MQTETTDTLTVHRIELPTHLPVGTVNAFVVAADGVRVLIDCGIHTDECRHLLVQGLEDLGITPNELDGLVLTHGHIDHTGSTAWFRAHGVPVFAHPGVGKWLDPDGPWSAYRRDFERAFYHRMGMTGSDLTRSAQITTFLHQLTDRSVVDVPLLEGMKFPLLPAFEVLYVPGHAQAAVALWHEGSGELIVGDQVLPRISSNAVVEPTPGAPSGDLAERTKSLLQYRENLQELRMLPIQTVYPGHGDPFTGASELLDARLLEQLERREQVLELLQQLDEPCAYEVATAFFPHRTDQPPLILSELIGFLDWLAVDGLVRSTLDADGVLRWRACQNTTKFDPSRRSLPG